MTNLSDFLKCEKVRCVDDTDFFKSGEEYKILDVRYKIEDKYKNKLWYSSDSCFEPVLETAIQATDSLDSTPMGTRTVNEFEVGDLVYYGITGTIREIAEVDIEDSAILFVGARVAINLSQCCHATPENYERLSATFENIKFEKPELTGSDLCRALLDKGWKYVPCYVSNNSDEFAIKIGLSELIIATDADRTKEFVGDDVWTYAVPFDPKTGNVLKSEVLDD